MTIKSYRFCIRKVYRNPCLPLQRLSRLLDSGEHDLSPRVRQQLPSWFSFSLHYQSRFPKNIRLKTSDPKTGLLRIAPLRLLSFQEKDKWATIAWGHLFCLSIIIFLPPITPALSAFEIKLGRRWKSFGFVNLLPLKTAIFHFSLMGICIYLLCTMPDTFCQFSQKSDGLLGGKNELRSCLRLYPGFLGGLAVKHPLANAGNTGSVPRLEKGMATHPSILAWKNPTDRGAWWATVHGVAKELEWLSC